MSKQVKHNGKLGKHEVSFCQEFVYIEEANRWQRDDYDFVQLTAKQALSLLAWLEENKETLLRLANQPLDDSTE